MLYSLKYSILIKTGSWEGAWPSIESAVKMFPDYVDLKFYMGVILYYKQMYQEALACFTECIELGDNNLNYLTTKGLGSFNAWFYKGLCWEGLKNEAEAILAYLNALMTSNNFSSANESLTRLINIQPVASLEPLINNLDNAKADYLRALLTKCN